MNFAYLKSPKKSELLPPYNIRFTTFVYIIFSTGWAIKDSCKFLCIY